MSLIILTWTRPPDPVTLEWVGPNRDTIGLAAVDPNAIAGLAGPPGISGNAAAGYVHTQATPSQTWNVNHNLGFFPNVTILTPGGLEVEAQISHISVNQFICNFTLAQTGQTIAR